MCSMSFLALFLIPSVIYHLVLGLYLFCVFVLAVSHPITTAACDHCHVFKQCVRSVTSTKILVAARNLLSCGSLRKTSPSLCLCTHHNCHELHSKRAKEMLLAGPGISQAGSSCSSSTPAPTSLSAGSWDQESVVETAWCCS